MYTYSYSTHLLNDAQQCLRVKESAQPVRGCLSQASNQESIHKRVSCAQILDPLLEGPMSGGRGGAYSSQPCRRYRECQQGQGSVNQTRGTRCQPVSSGRGGQNLLQILHERKLKVKSSIYS